MDEKTGVMGSIESHSAIPGIRGLGVDIVEIERMRQALLRRPRLKERLFSESEREYCEKRNRPEIHYAMRFAAKEAVLKAIGTGFSGMRFCDVEVVRDKRGRPRPVLHGRAADVAAETGVIELHLSLSFTHSTAVASAVAITSDHRPQREDPQADPRARLEASFREARLIFQEMDTADDQDAKSDTAVSGGELRTGARVADQ